MDFIVKLSKSKDPISNISYNSILVIMDRFTKYNKFTSANESHSIKDFADIVVREIISNHGLPDEFVTDKDTTFALQFFTILITKLGINSKLLTAFHF